MKLFWDFRIRLLSTDDELKTFAEGFCTVIDERSRGVIKANVPLDYLRASRVTGVFDRQNRMVAGYVVKSGLPLRLPGFVPVEAREAMTLPPGSTWDDCCELTCF